MKWRIRAGLIAVIVVQTVVYLLAGAGKAYIHMDEAYSLALAQYDKVDITENADFYNTWHTDVYYQDYLAVQAKDWGNWRPVYENQKNDVHPPLYYALLRVVMGLVPERFSKWPGIILNIIIMAGCTILLYLILIRLLAKEKWAEGKALVVALVAGLTVAGMSTAVYIRMYALLTLMVLLTLWLHLRWQEQKAPKWGWYVALGGVALLGTLTQYYYLFFLAGLVVAVSVRYIRQRQGKELVKYLGCLAVAGGLVLVIWPHILQHMFFGYRGQGVLSNLINLPVLAQNLWNYCQIVDYNVFHRLLPLILIIMVGLVVYRRIKRLPRRKLGGEFWLAFWPTLSYFGLAAVASPYLELRYIMPVCGLIFALVLYGMYRLLGGVLRENWRNVAMAITMAVVLVAAPIQIAQGRMRIELLYRDRQAVMTAVTEKPEVPILYFITTENNRFLDNILPFAEARQSYLVLDLLEPTAQEVKEILAGKNLDQGLLVFVSGSQDQERALVAVKQATGLGQADYIQGINMCDVYYLH